MDDYFTYVSGLMAQRDVDFANARRCLRIVQAFRPFERVVDFGCGIGSWLAAAQSLGANEAIGIDGPWVGNIFESLDGCIGFCNDQVTVKREQITIIDMANQPVPDFQKHFDLALTIEVAEHLPEHAADEFCWRLTQASDYILFSAATPGQGGFQHINEQPLSYWAEKFWRMRYVPLDPVRPSTASDAWMHAYLRRNVVMFVSYATLLGNPGLLRCARTLESISQPWQIW